VKVRVSALPPSSTVQPSGAFMAESPVLQRSLSPKRPPMASFSPIHSCGGVHSSRVRARARVELPTLATFALLEMSAGGAHLRCKGDD
jgi:hypothetical protein